MIVNFIKQSGGLTPHTDHDKEIFNKWKLGAVVCGDFKQVRNPRFHRKFFALLNLTFDYYEPSSGVLTADEKRIAKKIFMLLDNHNNQNGFFINFGREFMKSESQERRASIEAIEKAFNPFRKWLIVEAGYYDETFVPGGTMKEAKSISFAKMDDMEFSQLYKAVFDVCWRFVLSRVFTSEHEAEAAAVSLLNFT
tara:strand:+ start:678 stop:1262 length:585 start_codon:yes stop_codon:yes gene_type:complete